MNDNKEPLLDLDSAREAYLKQHPDAVDLIDSCAFNDAMHDITDGWGYFNKKLGEVEWLKNNE